ncbi:MAG: hypothetical protein K2G56_01315 [Eubacterium sp.]|nr:hypothetical protein [Eubacterium sp.]
MAEEAIQGIKDIIYPILPKFYIAMAIIAGIAIIISLLVILFKKKH